MSRSLFLTGNGKEAPDASDRAKEAGGVCWAWELLLLAFVNGRGWMCLGLMGDRFSKFFVRVVVSDVVAHVDLLHWGLGGGEEASNPSHRA